MAHKNGIITAPIDVLGDVAPLLGEKGGDVATLCMSGNINPFALFCPRYSSDNPGLVLDKAGFEVIAGQQGQRPDNTYECPAYGVWVPKLDIPNLTPAKYAELQAPARNTWYIARPTETTWKNIAHFDGYDHWTKPVKPMVSAALSVFNDVNNTRAVKINVTLTTPAPDGRIMSVSNLFGESGAWYFGFIAFRGSGSSTAINGNASSGKYDIAFIASSTVNIVKKDNLNATTVNVSCTDTIGANDQFTYRIIPFVCNKRGLNSNTKNGGTLAGVSGGKFYGLRIVEKVGDVEWESMKTLSVGSTEGDVLSFFNFKEAHAGDCYPNPRNTAFTVKNESGGTIGIEMLIVYGEHDRGVRLLDKYTQIDLCFSGYDENHNLITKDVTWNRGSKLSNSSNYNESITGNLEIFRDNTRDHTGGYENELFFYGKGSAVQTFLNAVTKNGGTVELNGQFHYTDEKGNAAVDSVLATWIPQITAE